MRRWVLAVLLALLTLSLPQPASAITFGEPDNGEHPYVGSFVAQVTNPDTGAIELFQLCTGTLIDADVVLSASHCFVGLEEFGVERVYFTLDEVIDADQDGLVDPGVHLLTGTAVTNPRYASGGANNTFDIAVFLLDQPVRGVTPAQLPEIGMLDSLSRQQVVTAVGYGTVRTDKRKGFQSFRVGWRREKVDQHLLSLTNAWATFSMNPSTGNGGTCYGDSGGPHLIGDVVVAITVTGDAPCRATDKTYRIDTPWALQFLAQFVAVPSAA